MKKYLLFIVMMLMPMLASADAVSLMNHSSASENVDNSVICSTIQRISFTRVTIDLHVNTDIEGTYLVGIMFSQEENLDIENLNSVRTSSNKNIHDLTFNIKGLELNTTYYYAPYIYDVQNNQYYYGDKSTFVTKGTPVPTEGEAIDLGLSVRWSSKNVNSESPEDPGGYYAWGETFEKEIYDYGNYIFADYENGYVNIGTDICGTQYDVATSKLGEKWRMPTYAQFSELIDNCEVIKFTYNDQIGYFFIGSNDNCIFIPCGGFKHYMYNDGPGIGKTNEAFYWTGTTHMASEVAKVGGYPYWYNGYMRWGYYDRVGGFNVRPVQPVYKYNLYYYVDNELYKTYSFEYETAITPEPAPEKEGYTFSGWSEIPETMPAHDVTVTGTFTINKYKLTYKVDGAEYKSYELEYGAKITPEPAPTKEGYTFSGWSEIPETMPAHDVTVTGTFTINKYKLTYKVDGAEYKSYELEYGAKITPEPAPTKEGYTFSGWSEIPETMPAHEVMVTGTFSVNKYKLTYTVDGEEYKSYKLDYGASITPEAALTKEGYTFSGWSEIPETMPAHDVTVTGTFSINSYKLTYMIDDKVYKETMYEYGATITPEPQPEGDYATFEWIDLPQTMPARDVVVYASYTSGIVELLMPRQQNVRVYSPIGKRLNSPQKGVNIIRMSNGRTKKIVVK